MIEEMFSRFQTLVVGLKVLNKGYTTADNVNKIIKSLPKKWRLMVTTFKVSRNLNNTTLEELVISLRSHKIGLEEDEPQKKVNLMALKSKGKHEKAKTLQAEEDEKSKESSKEDDELFLLSIRINQLWNQ